MEHQCQLSPTTASPQRFVDDCLGPKRCLQVTVLMVWILAVEVQAFFLKYLLWIPPRNLLNTYRLIIWFGNTRFCKRDGWIRWRMVYSGGYAGGA